MPVFEWLRGNIWSQVSRSPELVLHASGEVLNPAHLRVHLERCHLGDS